MLSKLLNQVAHNKKIILSIVLAAWSPSMAFAMTPGQVYEAVKDSVVVVKAYDQKGKPVGLGSGVVLPSGDIITNFHVVKAGARYTVGRGKHAVPATFTGADEDKDLCLITAPGLVAEPTRLGKADRLKVGDPVYAVGAPQGLELSLSEGIISQLRGGGPHPIIQTTVAISPGSSGGGLFNAEGELVGITTFYLKDSQSVNFAVPVEWIPEVAERKIRGRPRSKTPVAPVPGVKPQAGWEDRAKALLQKQDWPGLLAHCLRRTQAEPDNAIAWNVLGLAYGGLGRHREAIEAYREALRLKPDHAEAWNTLGVSYLELDRYREAIETSRQALRLKPNSVSAWTNLATAYALSGNRSAALEAVKELRRHDPKEADSLFNLIMKP